jgi:hypothetical protein
VMRAVAATVVLAAVALMGACGGSASNGVTGQRISSLSATILPSSVLNMSVAEENVHQALAQVQRTYLDATSVYSFRSADLLEATLQVSRFIDAARYRSSKFHAALVNQIGSSQPNLVRVGGADVYLTSGTQQRIAVWFNGRYMFVLATREDFPQPRTLLRRLLEVHPT